MEPVRYATVNLSACTEWQDMGYDAYCWDCERPTNNYLYT